MSAVFYRDFGVEYPLAVAAEGMYFVDANERRYLDMSGGAAVSPVGHGNPRVIEAICQQASRLAFAHTAFFTNEPQEALAEKIASRFGEPGARVYFVSGGSEANETAMKLVWQYWRAAGRSQKTIVISREFSYHGNTLGALGVSGNFRRRAFESVLHDWPRIPPCFAYRYQDPSESEQDYSERAAEALEEAILATGPAEVAAFIAEPVVGATLGAVPAVHGYLRRVREICDRHDVLFIADEIMCGSGRTGTYFAHEVDGVVPDIVTMAKGIGGGYQPLGAAVVRRKVAETVANGEPFASGHTYIGHATACAAGLAVQQSLDEDGLLERVGPAGRALRSALASRFGEHPHVGDIRGRGLFVGIEFVERRSDRKPFAASSALPSKLKSAALRRGLVCYPGGGTANGVDGAHVLLAPPFIIEQEHIDEFVHKFEAVLDDVFTQVADGVSDEL